MKPQKMKVSRPGFLTQLSKHHCHLSSIPLIHANLVSQKGSKMNNDFLKKISWESLHQGSEFTPEELLRLTARLATWEK